MIHLADAPRSGIVVIGLVVLLVTSVIAAGATITTTAETVDSVAVQDEDGIPGDAKLPGEGSNDSAGYSVSNAGDVNGDGVDDLIVGAPENNTGGYNAGAAYIVYGPVDADEVDLADADVKLFGVEDSDRAGYSVSTAGDVNGDGIDDVIVGAPGYDAGGFNAGAAYVVLGDESLSGEMSLDDADATLVGTSEGGRAGWSVSNAGDVNGDGADGVVVGAPIVDGKTGAVYFVPDERLTGTVDVAAQATGTLIGESVGDRAGFSVSHAGDVNGDGTADLIVGASFWNGTENRTRTDDTSDVGAAYLVTGGLEGERNLSTAALRLEGVNRSDHAGWSVSSAGDVNADGVDDVVVGVPYADPNGTNAAGIAYVVYGSEGLSGQRSLVDSDLLLTGEAANDTAGWSVANVGDVTCDRVDDVLVGAPGILAGGDTSGSAYVVSGSSDLAGPQSLSDAAATIRGEAAGDRAGFAVSDAGDVADDGSRDVVVGAPNHDVGDATDAGAVYVVEGDC